MESADFLSKQIITYIGNKRALLENISGEVSLVQKQLGGKPLACADLFSGSGIVCRMLKGFSQKIIANDLELYSKILNECYLTNRADFPKEKYLAYKNAIEKEFASRLNFFLHGDGKKKCAGLVSKNYAPLDDQNIKRGERAFYTRENALRIDIFRALIDEVVLEERMKKFFLGPLLAEASVHVNTSGVFKGFYKSKATGVGEFGGDGKNALRRILGKITLEEPVLSNYDCESEVFMEDAVSLSERLSGMDLAYLDPPYNQHPYGSNYFMLNLISKNNVEGPVSGVSGIPKNWNRSAFNRRRDALSSLEKIVSSLDAKFVIISYNSEGFLSFDQMQSMLKKYGSVKTSAINYNAFRGSRNLSGRDIHVAEYLFVLKKGGA